MPNEESRCEGSNYGLYDNGILPLAQTRSKNASSEQSLEFNGFLDLLGIPPPVEPPYCFALHFLYEVQGSTVLFPRDPHPVTC